MISVVDITARKIVKEVPVGVEPEGVGVSPDGKKVVATSETTNMAHFIDTESYEVIHNVLVGTRPRFAEFTHDGKQVWVSSELGGTVSVIDANNYKILKTIEFEIQGLKKEEIQPVGVRITNDDKWGIRSSRTCKPCGYSEC